VREYEGGIAPEVRLLPHVSAELGETYTSWIEYEV
jgi:hypothetical protein